MKNKKFIIIFIVIVIAVAVVFGIFMATHNPNYLYNEDGKIEDGHEELIEHLKEIEDTEERKKQIDFSLEQNIITKEEAEKLY